MTEVNGLRLAFRGFVSGIAGAYVWTAIAMALSGLLHGDPLEPLRPIATAISPLAGTPELAFVLGLATVQAGGAVIGMIFAYFFARFFTVRSTLAVAGPVVAVLAWALLTVAIEQGTGGVMATDQAVAVMATIGFGAILGANVPVRGDVTRYPGSPST
jgi:hypothetical protein